MNDLHHDTAWRSYEAVNAVYEAVCTLNMVEEPLEVDVKIASAFYFLLSPVSEMMMSVRY
jgi:hypothetical protein